TAGPWHAVVSDAGNARLGWAVILVQKTVARELAPARVRSTRKIGKCCRIVWGRSATQREQARSPHIPACPTLPALYIPWFRLSICSIASRFYIEEVLILFCPLSSLAHGIY